ncbi:hypothetical protein H0R92_08565 [Treponema sp. OMZ 840]|uniref:hypothetical protein n=1 Tax=Treponema sp. OMZ 840 TaxID=244313 RepID=UPI003D8F3AEA
MIYAVKTKLRFFMFYALLGLSVFSYPCFAQKLMDKMTESVNQRILLKEYDKAYANALFIIRNYAGQDFPLEEKETCARAVRHWIDYLEEHKRWEDILSVEKQLAQAPSDIRSLVRDGVLKARGELSRSAPSLPVDALSSSALPAASPLPPAVSLSKPENPAGYEAARQESGAFAEDSGMQKDSLEYEYSIHFLKLMEEQQKHFDSVIREMRRSEREKEKAYALEREEYKKYRIEAEAARAQAEADFTEKLNDIFKKNALLNRTVFLWALLLFSVFVAGCAGLYIFMYVQHKKIHRDIKNALAATEAVRSFFLSGQTKEERE